jgi:hypothetical protein
MRVATRRNELVAVGFSYTSYVTTVRFPSRLARRTDQQQQSAGVDLGIEEGTIVGTLRQAQVHHRDYRPPATSE